ncbi:YbhB/YbcL family Raf kinase inhibitor-like protein [Solimonas soli]|uniref:YbhB/YbcL family Raf kinase inhibitor-like protein n=1 Tax=Solimonas soli TaxID=413479 RepID=UPI0004853906|nr:YbhB/YbcL family Raf kinase inhibitor-like protein [Solimonas soli]
MSKHPLSAIAIALSAVTAVCTAAPAARPFRLTSPDIAEQRTLADAQVLEGFGCHGGNRSPALTWSAGPVGTKSYALTVYDPDAPTGSGWWHWVVVNLPADTVQLPAAAGGADGAMLPAGARQLSTDFGAPGYGGACPPPGDKPHRYVFTVYALDSVLELPANATPALAGFMIHAHTLASARITARYGR